MKQRSIALTALGALAGAAQAQTGVTLYGALDSSVEYVNRVAAAQPTYSAATGTLVPASQGGARVGLPTVGGLSASRWGLRGTEDLGGGLKAFFVLESGFGSDNGVLQSGGRLFGRAANIGLKGDIGSITLGRQYTAFFDGLANFSPLRLATTYEPVVWQLGANYREDNIVKYSGVFGPLKATVHYSFGVGVPVQGGALPATVLANGAAGETPGNPRDNAGYGAALTWFDGHIGATIAYDEWRPTIVTGQPGRIRKAAGAMSWENGPVKLTGGYRWNRNSFANGNTLIRDDYWWAGVNYAATRALMLEFAYYYADVKSFRAAPTGAATNPPNMQQYSFIADYNLSKRTDIYVSTGYSRNGALAFDSNVTVFSFGYPAMAGQKGMFGVMAGVRHTF